MGHGKQPRAPEPLQNLARAIRRDYGDASTGPFARAFLLGSSLETGPAVLKIIIGHALAKKRRAPIEVLRHLGRVSRRAFDVHSLGVFFGVALGGARWLEGLFEPIVERIVRSRRRQEDEEKGVELSVEERRSIKMASTTIAAFVSSLAGIILFQRNKRRRPPNSVLNPTPELVRKPQINGTSPTLELTLFVLVRASDSAVQALYRNLRGDRNGLSRFIASQMDTIVFTVSCYKIIWFYQPDRLPKAYVNWITRLSRMDTRLLELLRYARQGRFVYGIEPEAAVVKTCEGIANAMGVSSDLTLPHRTDKLPCVLVHGKTGKTESCEVNTIKRWLYGFQMSFGIYLPVHLVPRLVFSRRRLLKHPIKVLASILLGTAQSSAFLATFIASVYAGVCLGRTRLLPNLFPGQPQIVWDRGLSPMLGCLLCGLSVLIESKRRRGEMALYVAPRALYALMDDIFPLWLQSSQRGEAISRWSERLLFASSTAIMTTVAVHRPELSRGFVRGIMGYSVGKSWHAEAAPHVTAPTQH